MKVKYNINHYNLCSLFENIVFNPGTNGFNDARPWTTNPFFGWPYEFDQYLHGALGNPFGTSLTESTFGALASGVDIHGTHDDANPSTIDEAKPNTSGEQVPGKQLFLATIISLAD